MNGKIQIWGLLILGFLGFVFASTAARADEARGDLADSVESAEAASDRTIVYDYKKGNFVHVHHVNPTEYRLGNLKVDVGYDPQVHRSTDAWPESVNRSLYRRPL